MWTKENASEFVKWIHDDITWCGNECSHTECERNAANRWSNDPIYTASFFKGTDMCPLKGKEDETDMG